LAFAKDWQLQLKVYGQLNALKSDLADGFGYAVSDRSFKEQSGVAA